jgi:hypothetical protein
MATNSYRLGDYKIIESGTGELRWEAHSGFAEFQEGRCFTKGTILFICPAGSDQIGFLKGEFLDHIKAFPAWSKTRYSCRDFEIYNCKTGKRLTKQDMLMWMIGPSRGKKANAPKEGAFRLGRYEITRKTTGQIVWKTAPGPNTVSKGTCTVLEDILFIGPRESTESNLIERRFAKNLAQLPRWDQTGYYCAKSSLCDCRSFSNAQEERRTWPRNREPTGKHGHTEKLSKATRRKPAGLETLRRQALISSRLAAKSFIHLTEALRLVISFSSAGSIRFCKEIKRRWHLKKGKRPSVHHPEDQK